MRLPHADIEKSHPLASPRGVLLVLLAAAAVLAYAAPASAVIVHLPSGKTLSYQRLRGSSAVKPFDQLFSNLDYNGGPVMASNTNYVIYWQPSTGPAYPAEYQAGVNQYFEDVAHDSGGHENADSVAAQYNDAEGHFANYDSHFGGALIDTTPYPANGCTRATICLTDKQLQKELKEFVKAHGLPMDLAHEYFLLTPPTVEDCFEASGEQCSAGSEEPEYCAYHGEIPLGGEGEIVYANDPYVTGNGLCDDGNHPNGKPSDGVLEGGLSHEHNESITDPQPNNTWADVIGGGEENGDKCRKFNTTEFGTPLGKATNGAKYNQLINGHFYWYQQEWSNQGNRCLQRFTFSGPEPVATFASAPEAGSDMSFDATGSTAGGGVFAYNWQFNDGAGHTLSTPVETNVPTVSHTFPKAGTYLVALTVFAEDGTSIGTVRTIVTSHRGPTGAFSVTTASPTAGQAVGFDGSPSSATGGTIASYSWNFGDGTAAGTGVTPAHAYATAGTYVVTLTVADSFGQTASTSRSVVVGAHVFSGGGGGGTEEAATTTTTGGASTPAPATQVPVAPAGTTAVVPPDGGFTAVGASLNAKTGAITFTESVGDPGTFRWLLTFQNGRFGVFAASTSKCRKGFVRLGGRCRPSRIVFAKGSMFVAGRGVVRFTLKPSRSALKALKNALQKRKGIPVLATFTFQSSRGGSAVSHLQLLTVKLKKK